MSTPQAISKAELAKRFMSHELSDAQKELTNDIRTKALSLATFISRNVPDGRQKSIALTDLENASMRAVAAVAQADPDPATGEVPEPSAKGPGRPRKSATSSTPPPAPEAAAPAEEPVVKRPRRARGTAAAALAE